MCLFRPDRGLWGSVGLLRKAGAECGPRRNEMPLSASDRDVRLVPLHPGPRRAPILGSRPSESRVPDRIVLDFVSRAGARDYVGLLGSVVLVMNLRPHETGPLLAQTHVLHWDSLYRLPAVCYNPRFLSLGVPVWAVLFVNLVRTDAKRVPNGPGRRPGPLGTPLRPSA